MKERTEFKAVRVSRWKKKKRKKQEPVREEIELQQRWSQNFKLDWIGIKRHAARRLSPRSLCQAPYKVTLTHSVSF